MLGDGDVRVVWYADLLGTRREPTCDDAAGSPDAPVSPLNTLALFAGALLDVASASAGDTAAAAGAELRGLVGDLRFFGDRGTRCAAERRVGSALARAAAEGRPVVLVAHSLGGLVAWGHLRARGASAAPAVHRFVTLGSPVGSADVRRLVFGDATPSLTLPAAVRSWVNVRAPGDPFAARLLGDGPGDGGAGIGDARIADALAERPGADPHGLTGYLRDPATARAVLGAWCDASPQRGGACATLAAVSRAPR
jgi:hypothetical protein